jgi:hypothetical protein
VFHTSPPLYQDLSVPRHTAYLNASWTRLIRPESSRETLVQLSCPEHLTSRSTTYTPSNTSNRSRSRICRKKAHHGRPVRLWLRHLSRHQHGVVRGPFGAVSFAADNNGKATAFATLASLSHFDESRHGPAEWRLHANPRIAREPTRTSQHQLLERHHKSARRSAFKLRSKSTFAAQEGKAWAYEPETDASAKSHGERQQTGYSG